MQFINGVMSSSISYSYVIQPRSEGKLTIGSASIEVGGKQYQTQPITIEAAKGAPRPPQQRRQTDEETLAEQIGDDLFLKVTADKSRVYQGEQLTVTYKVYTRVNIVNYSVSKVPALTGFWSEELESPQQIQLTTEIVNGKQYRVGTLKKVALFAQRSGTIELDPMEVGCVAQLNVRRQSRDFFDQVFADPFGSAVNVNRKIRSQSVKLTVLPLPSDNVPMGFNGAVGKFSMDAWLDKRETKTNEPVTLKIKISGRGNLKLLDAPTVTLPSDLERYEPKISDNISKQGNQISGDRVFEYLLVPRHPGEFNIPSIPFSYFDVEKKAYVSASSQGFLLTVARGSDAITATVAGLTKEEVKMLGEDIRFIKSGDVRIRRTGDRLLGSGVFYLMTFAPVLALGGFVAVVRKRRQLTSDIRLVRTRRARKVAQRRLTQAEKSLREKKREDFFQEVSRALWGYIADKLGIMPADLSLDVARASLNARGVSDEMIGRLTSALEKCEFARYAPSADTMEMDRFFEEAVSLISTIEEQIR
jgi:hypothetical protein